MQRAAVKLVLLALVLIAAAFFERPAATGPSSGDSGSPSTEIRGDTRSSWGRPETLADHFARHGRDFGAKDANDYAVQAAALLQRARTQGLPAKRDADGSLRVFDPATGAFGAYNRNGTTKTFFKPGKPEYFDRQPGTKVDLRNGS